MGDLTRLSAAQLAAVVASGQASAVEVAQAHLDRIEAVDSSVRAFLHVDAEGALAAARAVDLRRAAGEELSPLAGVPLAMKDIVVTQGLPTTAGSKILEGWRPPYDATITRRVKDAGIVMLGKTNMDEFAMGSSTENSAYHPTHNPWDLSRVPGGSSGGSSAAVAAFEAPLAIGTDTGGSIRQPGGGHRNRRAQAHLRRGVSLRADRVLVLARPGRPVRAHRARRRAAARGHRRARPGRLDVHPAPGGAGRRGGPARVRAAT